jgi:hypothetical protein
VSITDIERRSSMLIALIEMAAGGLFAHGLIATANLMLSH